MQQTLKRYLPFGRTTTASRPADKSDSKGAAQRPLNEIARDPRVWLNDVLPLPKAPRPIVISLVGKGGSGKTTSCVSIATIASYLGYTTWVLDLDPQKSASCWWVRRQTGGVNRAVAETQLHAGRSRDLRTALDNARRADVDLVVIDNPPTRHEYAIAVARSADLVVITCGPTLFDVEETRRWIRFLRTHLVNHCIALGNAPPRRDGHDSPLIVSARHALETTLADGAAQVHPMVWLGQVTRRHAVITATARGMATIESEPSSASAREFRRLWNFIVHQMGEVGR